jgi:16S rRNA processing protein RimM
VNLDTDFPEERFRVGGVLLVGPDQIPRAIRAVRFHQGRPIIALEGIETMNDAEGLAGQELKVDASTLAPLPEGTFYHHDLVGCEVRGADGRRIGTVAAVEGAMEMSRLVVASEGGEVQIPLVSEICTSIDLEARQIHVSLPEGLVELNAGRG